MGSAGASSSLANQANCSWPWPCPVSPTGDNIVQRAAEVASEAMGMSSPPVPVPVEVVGRMLNGTEFKLPALTSDTVSNFKTRLAQMMEGVHWSQLTLTHETALLTNKDALSKVHTGNEDTIILTIVIGRKVPDWAADLGFDSRHPDFLREHYTKQQLDIPEAFEDDEQVWNALHTEYAARGDQMKGATCWGHKVCLVEDGKQVGQIVAAPGQQVEFSVAGKIWNKNRDACIQQCGLALQGECVSQLYHGVPSRPASINKEVRLTAPEHPGAYMLYRFGDLQYTFEAAQRKFSQESYKDTAVYPNAFVGWLIVD